MKLWAVLMLLLLLTLLLMRYDTIEYVKKVFVNFIYRPHGTKKKQKSNEKN